MRPSPPLRALLAALVVTVGVPASGATSVQVEQSILRAKKFLYSQQTNGTWEKAQKQDPKTEDRFTGSQWGGQTALVAYALLATGENPNSEPKLAAAVEFLKKAKIGGTYALGARCQVWALLPQTPEVKSLMKRDAAALQTMMKTSGNAKGFYDYDAKGGPNTYSLSRSQYAVLGMWAAAASGVEVPTEYWRKVEAAWTGAQEPDGGWRYQKGGRDYPVTAGMTAAGVASLLVAQEYLLAESAGPCNGNPASSAVDRGIGWLAQNFDKVAPEQEYERSYPFATLYAVERVGVASGLKYFRGVDWYQTGADYLVARQRDDGAWKGRTGDFGAVPDTCFGILFLARGRAPLIMNKWVHGDDTREIARRTPEGKTLPGGGTLLITSPKPDAVSAAKKLGAKGPDWNQRPRDVANLANWISTVAERELNWQLLDAAATPRDLYDAPILYLSGTQALKIDDETKAKFREYVEGGGLILGHADCGGRPFVVSFKKLASEMFPKYEFRELPAEHVIYTGGVFPRSKWKSKPSLQGISNGARELMLLIPLADAGRAWQSRMVGGKEELWQLGADIFFYTAERKNLRYRGESHYVQANPQVQPMREVSVARLEYSGNWDPEPGGWRRLANVLLNERQVKLNVVPVKLGTGTLDTQLRFAHLTGSAAFKLDEPARSEIRKFVEGGGTVLFEAAGGSSAFATAADVEVKALFPGAPSAVLGAAHPAYMLGLSRLDAVAYRPFAQKVVGSTRTPRITGVTVNGRVGVLVSREDLSVGLVGQSVDGVVGYDPRTATDIMTRLILSAAAPAHGQAEP